MALNFGTLVGHGNLRYAVMGGADWPATPAEREAMAEMLAQVLEEVIEVGRTYGVPVQISHLKVASRAC